MDVLTRYGNGGLSGRVYDFDPENQVSLSDNFTNVVTRAERLPGVSGGFAAYGEEALPSEIGSISYTYWMHYESAAAGKAAVEALKALTEWGMQRLYKQPMGSGDVRFCYAAVNNVSANWNAESVNHRRMQVTITFHVPDPFWYSYPFDVLFMDAGLVMDAGLSMGGWTDTQFILSGADTLSIAVDGNAAALPVVWVEAAGRQDVFLGDVGLVLGGGGLVLGGVSSGSVRDVSIAVVDRDTLRERHRVVWHGLISGNDRLMIDSTSEKVIYENSFRGNLSGWDGLDRTRATFLKLLPGVNRVDVSGVFSGTVLVRFEYLEAWR